MAGPVGHATPDEPVPPDAPTDPAVPIALLVDLSSGTILFASNAERRFIPASITKVMTLYVAFEMIAAGKLEPEQRFPLSDDTFRAWNNRGSNMFMPAGSEASVDDLLRGIATVSANDGAMVLAEGAAGSIDRWVAQMNRTARDLGMKNSHFGTPNGWPDHGRTFTTAEDLTILARAMITRHPELYARYIGKPDFRFNGIAQANRDPISGSLEGADGIKTGFTNQAGYGFLGSAIRDRRRLIVVVAAAETESARNRQARALLEWGFAATSSRPLFEPGATVGQALVQNGDGLTVPLVAGASGITAAMASSTKPDLLLDIHYDGPLKAPVRRGEQVAELEIRAGDMPPSRVPLYAGEGVHVATGVTRIKNGIAGIFRW
ncbi:MAG: D-alanyl-D-alanine carboxypeptidase family protein [Sphingomonadaceae bacterium]